MSAETEGESRRESNRRISHIKINETNEIKELYRAIWRFLKLKSKECKGKTKVEEEWETMEAICEVRNDKQTDRLETLRLKMKSGNHNLPWWKSKNSGKQNATNAN